jgi:hypothetical protein
MATASNARQAKFLVIAKVRSALNKISVLDTISPEERKIAATYYRTTGSRSYIDINEKTIEEIADILREDIYDVMNALSREVI